MKNMKMYYSVLSYMPSSIRREAINVGMVFHVPEKAFSKFVSLKSFKRIENFDDEYNPNFFKMMMESFHYEFDFPNMQLLEQYDTYKDIEFRNIERSDFLDSKTRYYANEFQFFNTQGLLVPEKDFAITMDNLQKTYLYYDRPKSERISKRDVQKLLSNRIRYSGMTGYERNPKEYLSDFDDEPLFDYKIGDSLIKIMTFDYSKKGNLSKELKSAIYDIEHLDNQTSSEIKFIINDNAFEESEDIVDRFSKSFNTNLNIDILPVTRFLSTQF